MQVRVEGFGAASRLIHGQLTVDLQEGSTVIDLLAVLSAKSSDFAVVLQRCACARGDVLLPRSTVLADGDELALLPPVAGG